MLRAFFSDKVGDNPHFLIPEHSSITAAFPCDAESGRRVKPLNPRDRASITFYLGAAATRPTALRWDKIATSMLDWINKVAQGTEHYDMVYTSSVK